MGEDSGGGKSTLVQAPQKSSAPIRTSTVGGGFIKNQKSKKGMTAADFKFKNDSPPPSTTSSSAGAPKNPYPKLHRNDKCGCGSGEKYKRCCLK